MSEDKIIRTLAEFFLDQFAEDPAGIADWLAQGGQDTDEFYAAVKKIGLGG